MDRIEHPGQGTGGSHEGHRVEAVADTMRDQEDDRYPDRSSSQPLNLKPAALLIALGLALEAQYLLSQRNLVLAGVIFYTVAIAFFLWGVGGWDGGERLMPIPEASAHREDSRERPSPPSVRIGLGLLSLPLALLAYQGFAGNRFSTLGLVAWGGALVTYCLAAVGFLPVSRFIDRVRFRGMRLLEGVQRPRLRFHLSRTTILLAAITLIGVFFRVYRLAGVPPEMTADHAEKLLDVYDVLNGARPIFFSRNTGREAMQFYLTAALIRFTPLTFSHLTLKVGTALVSIVAVPLTYALGRAIYGRGIGLLAASFVALSRWHIAISRVGLRFPFTPTFVALTLLFFFRAFRHNRRGDWLACGLALGAGLHGYMSMRFVPLLLVVLTGAKVAFDAIRRLRHRTMGAEATPKRWVEQTALSSRFWGHAVLGAGASLLVFLPLLRYWRDEPEMFWYRVLTRVSSLEKPLSGGPWQLLFANVKDALLMFNYRGGPVWVNTVPGDSVLDTVVGGLFVLGVAFALWQLLYRGDRRAAYLLLSLFVLLLPSATSLAFPEENPSVVRAGGAIPIVALLSALPVYVVVGALGDALGPRSRWRTLVVLGALFISTAGLTYNWYFGEYERQYRRQAWNATELGRVARAFADNVGDLDHVYHIAYPWWVHTPNIGINAGDVTWRNVVLDLDDLADHAKDPAPKLYLLHVDDRGSLNALRFRFPLGRLQRCESAVPGQDFLIYFVPGDDPGLLREDFCTE
jgi:hypothetical protein